MAARSLKGRLPWATAVCATLWHGHPYRGLAVIRLMFSNMLKAWACNCGGRWRFFWGASTGVLFYTKEQKGLRFFDGKT